MKARLAFAWFDIWIGVFVDWPNKRLYICPLPCVLIILSFSEPAS